MIITTFIKYYIIRWKDYAQYLLASTSINLRIEILYIGKCHLVLPWRLQRSYRYLKNIQMQVVSFFDVHSSGDVHICFLFLYIQSSGEFPYIRIIYPYILTNKPYNWWILKVWLSKYIHMFWMMLTVNYNEISSFFILSWEVVA